MNETDIEKELRCSSTSVGVGDAKASKMIALLSHRKSSMELRYDGDTAPGVVSNVGARINYIN